MEKAKIINLSKDMNEEKNEPMVEVPVAWFEGLLRKIENYENSQEPNKTTYLNILLGYISSAKTIIKYNKKK